MAEKRTPQEILEILHSKDFDELIGLIEYSQFDAKQKYSLDSDRGKYELAKDVAAMANSDGGVLVVGLTTDKIQETKEEVVAAVSLLKEEEANKEQYEHLVANRIYPCIKGLSVDWVPSIRNQGMGLLAITVPNQAGDDKPFLIKNVVEEDGSRLKEIIFSYPFRVTDHTKSHNVERIHSLIKGGERNGDVVDRLDNLHALIAAKCGHPVGDDSATSKGDTSCGSVELNQIEGKESEEKISGPATAIPSSRMFTTNLEIGEQLVAERVEIAAQAAGLDDGPVYSLVAIPSLPSEVESIFESRDAPVVTALLRPPKYRDAGFGVSTTMDTRPVLGKLRRVGREDSGAIVDLWRDGTLVFVEEGNEHFLCWPRPINGWLKINQVALIESVVVFALYTKKVYEHLSPKPDDVKLWVRIMGMRSDGAVMYLPRNRFSDPPPRGAEAHEDICTCHINWNIERISYQRAAYLLISEVFAWFGVESEDIWYREKENDEWVINEENFYKMRR